MARLVFCEDDPTIQRVIQVALRATGHEVHLAADGAAGLALIERVRPDLIFTDLSMPEMDGYRLIPQPVSRRSVGSYWSACRR